MKSAIKFDSVADRIKFKQREHARIKREREIIDESDRSISAFVWYCMPALLLTLLIGALFLACKITPLIGITG